MISFFNKLFYKKSDSAEAIPKEFDSNSEIQNLENELKNKISKCLNDNNWVITLDDDVTCIMRHSNYNSLRFIYSKKNIRNKYEIEYDNMKIHLSQDIMHNFYENIILEVRSKYLKNIIKKLN